MELTQYNYYDDTEFVAEVAYLVAVDDGLSPRVVEIMVEMAQRLNLTASNDGDDT